MLSATEHWFRHCKASGCVGSENLALDKVVRSDLSNICQVANFYDWLLLTSWPHDQSDFGSVWYLTNWHPVCTFDKLTPCLYFWQIDTLFLIMSYWLFGLGELTLPHFQSWLAWKNLKMYFVAKKAKRNDRTVDPCPSSHELPMLTTKQPPNLLNFRSNWWICCRCFCHSYY